MIKIKQLSEKLANMIAAGEVIDRPASVIKELVENAIDAKATIIKIEVSDFGLSLIKVTDNGTGMSKEDALLAFSRHATSKIISETDLNYIDSLGFRGEALPSIAAVSKVLLQTREDDSEGFEVYLEGLHKKHEKVTRMNKGTIVTVKDLFFNTPARFKYIKSDTAEKNAIYEIFNALALSSPFIAFQLYMDNKLVKETYGNGDMAALLAGIYDNDIAKDFIYFKEIFQKITFDGYLINPKYTRSRKKDIHIFLNGRYIKNYLLTDAVVNGYHSFLMNNRYPMAVIYISIDASLIDVNVHPQKTEVKLSNEYLLNYQLVNFIKEALKRSVMTVTSAKVAPIAAEITSLDLHFSEALPATIIEERAKTISETPKISNHKLPFFEYIGTLGGTYLLMQNEDGLFLIDQHAAAERIRYERILHELSSLEVVIKNMLIPYTIMLSERALLALIKYRDNLYKMGFIFNDNNQVIAIPHFLDIDNLAEELDLILSCLMEHDHFDLLDLHDKLAKSIACKGAIKANQNLSITEINKLINTLDTSDNPYTCPHGRPIIINISYHEIEKLFKRIL